MWNVNLANDLHRPDSVLTGGKRSKFRSSEDCGSRGYYLLFKGSFINYLICLGVCSIIIYKCRFSSVHMIVLPSSKLI